MSDSKQLLVIVLAILFLAYAGPAIWQAFTQVTISEIQRTYQYGQP